MAYIIKEETTLLAFLYSLNHLSKKEAKSLLTKGNIYVNNEAQTYYQYPLHVGDEVLIQKNKKTNLDIIYEDDDMIVINKPSGLLSMATDRQKEKTAYHLVREYLQQSSKQARVFIVHRLDQDTSGVLLFAKNEKFKHLLQESWNDLVKVRGYLAIIEGTMPQPQGTIKTYLKESKTNKVYVTKQRDGKLAITHYKQMKVNQRYSLVEVQLDTGRKNQIRVHFSYLGHPIVGDKKYGSTINPIGRLGLHSHCLELIHPVTHKIMHFEAPIPESMERLIK